MKIIPKISTNDYENLDIIEGFMKNYDSVEIQIMDEDWESEFLKTLVIINEFQNLEYVVLHLPFKSCNLAYVLSNPEEKQKFKELIVSCVDISENAGIKMDVLTHIVSTPYEYRNLKIDTFLRWADEQIGDSGTNILIENSIINLHSCQDGDIIEEIFKDEYKNICFCLDICHLQASENIMKRDISISENLNKNLKNVHFSCTKNNDGYIDKKNTHGVVHESIKDVVNDIEYLRNKRIDLDNINFVAEISENDYKYRPNLLKELELLQIAIKDFI